MTEIDIGNMQEDLRAIKQDIAVIKDALLNEDGELTDEAKQRLAEARGTPDVEYAEL